MYWNADSKRGCKCEHTNSTVAMFGSAFRVSYSLKKHSSDNNSFVHSFCLCTCNLMGGPYKVSTRSRPHVIEWHQIFSQTEDFESTSQFHVKLGRARSRHLPPTARWNNRSQRPQVFLGFSWRKCGGSFWFFDRMMEGRSQVRTRPKSQDVLDLFWWLFSYNKFGAFTDEFWIFLRRSPENTLTRVK